MLSALQNGNRRRLDVYDYFIVKAEGPNAGTTFKDRSRFGRTISRTGGVVSTAVSLFGMPSIDITPGSVCCSPTPSNISVPDSADFILGTSNFTIDCWFYMRSIPVTDLGPIFAQSVSGANRLTGHVDTAGAIGFAVTGLSLTSSAGLVAVNTWYHYSIVRMGTLFNLYLNGNVVATATNTISLADYSSAFMLGAYFANPALGGDFTGNITNFRLSKGIARWQSNFIPPRQAFF